MHLFTTVKETRSQVIGESNLERAAEIQMVTVNNNIMAAPVMYKKVPKKVIDQCLRLYHDQLYVIWPMLSYDDLYKLGGKL